MPPDSSRKPDRSNAPGGGTRPAGMNSMLIAAPSRATGRLIRKIQCQEATSTSQPPSEGPISGPISPGMAMKPMARRNCSRGKARSTASRPTGINSAPPSPCTTREATSAPRLWEIAHSKEPRANSAIASRYILRVPNRSAIQPEAGISMAMVSEYATTTDCIRSGLSPRLAAMAGSAVLTMVASSVCMKNPMATSHSRLRPLAAGLEDAGAMESEEEKIQTKSRLAAAWAGAGQARTGIRQRSWSRSRRCWWRWGS